MPESGSFGAVLAGARAWRLRAERGFVFWTIGYLEYRTLFLFRARLALGLGAQAQRIEADVDDVCVEVAAARDRKAHVLLDMHERHAGLARRNGDGELVELAQHRFRRGSLLHHRHAQRDIDLAGAAGGAEQHAAFDANLHGHDASERRALACHLPDRDLIARGHRPGLGARLGDGERRCALAHRDTRTIDLRSRTAWRVAVRWRIRGFAEPKPAAELVGNGFLRNGGRDHAKRARNEGNPRGGIHY